MITYEKINILLFKLILGIDLSDDDKLVLDALDYIISKYGSDKK